MWILFLIVIVICLGQFHLHKRRLMKNLQHLPVEHGFPLLGIGYSFMGKSTTDIYYQLIKYSEAKQNPSILWFGPTLIMIISSAEDMQTVLNSPHCLQKAHVYDNLGVNDGIFKSKVHIWKQHRKLLNPTFNHKILTSFIPIFNEKTIIMADKLKQFLHQDNHFDISKLFFACTLDTVCATSLGANFDFQKEKNCEILESMEKYSEIAAERLVKLWLHWDCIYKWSNLCKIQTKMLQTFETLPKEIFRLKQKEFNEAKANSIEDRNESDEFKEPQIFVNELLRLQSKGLIDDRVVYDQIVTMIIGGMETTALTSSHVILMLAMHQDVQEKVFQEIKSAHANQFCVTEAEAMTKLNYLEMVIRETMRLLPVGPFLGRETLEEVKISNCTIPKGALLLLAFHVLHRDKSVWGQSPEKFDPNHFLPEKVANRHPYAFLPFSGGPRNCIGIKYAWLSIKVMICALVRRYKFTTNVKFEDLVLKWDVTLKIANGHLVQIEPRIY